MERWRQDKERHILSVGKGGGERERERERVCFEIDRELFITGPRVKNNKKITLTVCILLGLLISNKSLSLNYFNYFIPVY